MFKAIIQGIGNIIGTFIGKIILTIFILVLLSLLGK